MYFEDLIKKANNPIIEIGDSEIITALCKNRGLTHFYMSDFKFAEYK